MYESFEYGQHLILCLPNSGNLLLQIPYGFLQIVWTDWPVRVANFPLFLLHLLLLELFHLYF